MGILEAIGIRKPPEQKLDYTEALLLPLQLAGPSFGQSYANAVANSYQVNSVAHRAIRLIAENMAAVPWALYQGDDPVEAHWVLDSLRRPNPTLSGTMFKQILAGDLTTAGEAFILRIQPRPEAQAELHALRPDYVKLHKAERLGEPPLYEYRAPGQDPTTYTAEEVLHIHTLDLLRTGRGFSSIYATAYDLDQSNLSGKWNVSLLRNGGRPSMVVLAKQRLSPEQKQMLRDSVEEMHAGAGNAGKVAVFSGAEIDVKDVGFSPKDMDWKEGIAAVNSRIATGLGVPPEMLNLGQTTFNNRSEAKASFYEETIVPMFGLIAEALTAWLVPPGLELRGYWEKVEALQPNRNEEYERLDKSVTAGWLKINDAREEAGFEPDDEFGDLYRWQAEAISRFGRAGGQSPEPPEAARHTVLLERKLNLNDESEKTLYWKAQDDRKQAFESALADQLREAFDAERLELADRFSGIPSADAMSDVAVDVVSDKRMMEVLEPAWMAILEDFGEIELTQLGVKSREVKQFEDVFGDYLSEILAFAGKEVAESVVNVNATTKNLIRERVSAGIRTGQSIPAIAKSVDDLYLDQIIPNRSTVIARTETIKASNAGSYGAAKGTGLPVVRSWLATRDDRVRTDHLQAELAEINQRVPLNAKFLVGGEELEYPGDPSGSPWNVIQCRCTTVDEIDTSGATESEPPPWDPIDEPTARATLKDDFSIDRLGAAYDNQKIGAIGQYTGKGYEALNAALRTGSALDESASAVVGLLDDALAAPIARLPKDMSLWRGYVVKNKAIPRKDISAMIGTTLDDPAYVSTSVSRHVGSRWAKPKRSHTAIRIEVRAREGQKGLYVENVSSVPGEFEVLLPRGTKFRIVDAKWGENENLLFAKTREVLDLVVEVVD